MKPILYIANVDEDALDADLAEIDGCQPVPISAEVEADLAELDPAEAKEYLEAMGLGESRLGAPGAQRLQAAGPAELFYQRRNGNARLDHSHRREGPAGSWRHSSDFERGFIKAETASNIPTTWSWVASWVAATPASCVRKARSTWCRTATLCILSSTFKTPVQSHVLGPRRKRSLLQRVTRLVRRQISELHGVNPGNRLRPALICVATVAVSALDGR